VEEHFEALTKPRTKLLGGMSLVEYRQSLPKFEFPEDFNWNEESYKARAKKYGLEDLF
jgi:hypothetical protein